MTTERQARLAVGAQSFGSQQLAVNKLAQADSQMYDSRPNLQFVIRARWAQYQRGVMKWNDLLQPAPTACTASHTVQWNQRTNGWTCIVSALTLICYIGLF